MPLEIYRRHSEGCPNEGNRFSFHTTPKGPPDCTCPLWVEGSEDGVYRRHSLKTRNYEKARKLRRKMEQPDAPKATPKPLSKPLPEALDAFIGDCEARKLSDATLKKFRALKRQIEAFAAAHKILSVPDFTPDRVGQFRESWKDGSISALKKLERLRSVFRHFKKQGWIEKNPAKGLKAPVVTEPPTLPFTDKEVSVILKHAHGRWHTLYLLFLNSGLRIGDAMKLTPAQFEDNKVFLYMQKTRVPVYVPLPDYLIEELKGLPLMSGYYFWNRKGGSLVAATGNARRTFRAICKKAGVENGHPHRFRDTFAVNLLLKGVPLETVSILLGHGSIKVTQKHYAPWVKSRQEKLELEVAKIWKQPKLVRVK